MLLNIANQIIEIINEQINNAQTVTCYRRPLIGFASAHDPLFTQMKEIIGPHHLLPTDLLPTAKTVVAFFLPFAEDIVKAHRKSPNIPLEWSAAYIDTNALIETISQELKRELASSGISAVTQKATHNFNEQDLTAVWSHKSVAYVAGLGTFGLNQMLITPSGCAGRFGSLIISAEVPPSPRPAVEYCSYKREGKCQFCINNCPTGSLTQEGLNKQKCYEQLLKVNQEFPDLGLCDVCGKCAIGPCALKNDG
ncbi:epoxyqueuosine reductase [Desulfitobacterium sp.]|uniref:epoxyqueuosine reductase n=1 Tax=Desulfitobacterium sp. TaxID=49981 RepID=UPI002D1A27E1|nr:epoxyqueuosine reductase [Desulfitobacterium sp.]HVJ50210.1 epoxyqueuosine reductase [Desulfitobacterium sp.]